MPKDGDFDFEWVSGDGGPLLLLEKALLPKWEGSDEPSNGRVVQAEHRWGLDVATDYDKACDVSDWAGVIDVEGGSGFVFSTSNHSATWLPEIDGENGALIEWGFADSEAQLIEEARFSVASGDFVSRLKFEVNSTPSIVFVAAERGDESIYKRIEFDIEPGKYEVETCVRESDKTLVVCHVFKRDYI